MKKILVILIILTSFIFSQNAYDVLRPFYGFKNLQTTTSSVGNATVASGYYIKGYTSNPANIGLYKTIGLQTNYINSNFDSDGNTISDGTMGGLNFILPIRTYVGSLVFGFGINKESHFSSTADWNDIKYEENGYLKSKSLYFSVEFSKDLFIGSEIKYYSGKDRMTETDYITGDTYYYNPNFKGWGFVFGLLKKINNNFNFGLSIELPIKLEVDDKYSEWNSNDITNEYSDVWHYDITKPATIHTGFSYSNEFLNIFYELESVDWKNLKFDSNQYYNSDIFEINNDIKSTFSRTNSHYFGIGYHPKKTLLDIYFGYQYMPVPFKGTYKSDKKESYSLGLSYMLSQDISIQSCYKKYKWVYEGVSEDYSQYSIGISLYLVSIFIKNAVPY